MTERNITAVQAAQGDQEAYIREVSPARRRLPTRSPRPRACSTRGRSGRGVRCAEGQGAGLSSLALGLGALLMPETVESLFWITVCAVLAPLAVGLGAAPQGARGRRAARARGADRSARARARRHRPGRERPARAGARACCSCSRATRSRSRSSSAAVDAAHCGPGSRPWRSRSPSSECSELTDAIHAEVAVAIALTSTALGTLLPILKDSGTARQPLRGHLDEPRRVRRARADRGDGGAARHPGAGAVAGGAGRVRGAGRARARLVSPGSAVRARGCCT